MRKRGIGLAAVIVAVVVAGCGNVASVSTGPYWLVKVRGDYANVYRYPSGYSPGTRKAVELGATATVEHEKLAAAASKLGVPLSHVATGTAG